MVMSSVQQQDANFAAALAAGKITQAQYNTAMGYQNSQQNNVGKSLQQSQGGTLPTQAPVSSQGTIQQQNANFEQAKESGAITQAQYDQAMNVQNQNANFLAAKNTGQITQDQYNQAISFQQAQPQTASSLGISDDLFQQAKQTAPTGAYITGVTPTQVNYIPKEQIYQERASTNESLNINNQFAQQQTDYAGFGEALQSGKINQSQYNQAISYENQLQIATIQRAQKGGFIDAATAQTQIGTINQNYDTYINSQVNTQNEKFDLNEQFSKQQTDYAGFGSALAAGKITQAQYNQAIGYENQLQIANIQKSQKEGFIDSTTAAVSIASINQGYNNFLSSQAKASQPHTTTLNDVITNPFGTAFGIAESLTKVFITASDVATKQPVQPGISLGMSPVVRIANVLAGVEGLGMNQWTQLHNFGANFVNLIPGQNMKQTPLPYTPLNQTQQYGSYAGQGLEIAAEVALGGPTALFGAGLNVAIGQGMNFLPKIPFINPNPTGKVGSPTEMLNQAVVGGAFADVAEGLMGGLEGVATSQTDNILGSVAARAAWTAPGRVATYTALGAGVGYGSTGTPEGALAGGIFGFGFSTTGEILNRAAPTIQGKTSDTGNKLTDYVQSKLIDANLDKLQNIDDSYQQAYNEGKAWQPSRTDNLVMRTTGLRPIEPSTNIIELPTVTTEPLGTMDVSAKTFNLFDKNAMATSIADPGSTLFGKSIEPTEPTINQTNIGTKNLPEFSFDGEDLVPNKNELSFTGGKAAVTRPNESFQKIGNFDKYPLGSDMNLQDIKNNIDFFPKTEKPATFKGNTEPFQGDYWNNSISGQKSVLKNNPFAQELITGQAAQPTGATKVVSDFQTGRTVNTARTVNPITQAFNPTKYSGSLFPGTQRQRQQEDETTTYYSLPNSGLQHPTQPKFITEQTQFKERDIVTNQLNQPNLFNPQIGKIGQGSPLKSNLTPFTDIGQTQNQQPNLIQSFITTPIQTTNTGPIFTPFTPTKTTPTTPTSDIGNIIIPNTPFPFLGSKAMEFGGNKGDNPFFSGVGSVKRVYPIATAKEFWG